MCKPTAESIRCGLETWRPVMTRSLLPLALFLSGCSDMTGIWLFEIPYQDDSTSCTTQIGENFVEGAVPEAGTSGVGPWNYTYDYEGSGSVAFGQIETYGDDSAVLILGSTVYTGSKEQGNWVFSWVDESTESNQNEYAANGQVTYGYLQRDTRVSDISYTFVLDGRNKAEVSVDADETVTREWFESDTWTEEVANTIGSTGEMPSANYLVGVDGFGQANDAETIDCDQSRQGLCYLAVETSCAAEGDFVAYRTDFEDEDHYRSIRDAGNGGASGGTGGTGGWDTGY